MPFFLLFQSLKQAVNSRNYIDMPLFRLKYQQFIFCLFQKAGIYPEYFENILNNKVKQGKEKIVSELNLIEKKEEQRLNEQKDLISKYRFDSESKRLIEMMNYIIVLTDVRKKYAVKTFIFIILF